MVEAVKAGEVRAVRDAKGRFVKGCPGNPLGRPRVPEIDQLRAVLQKVAKEKDISFLEHFVDRAYTNDVVAIALAKKLLPDKIEAKEEFTFTEVQRKEIIVRVTDYLRRHQLVG